MDPYVDYRSMLVLVSDFYMIFPTPFPDPDEEFQNADAEEDDPGDDPAITYRYEKVISFSYCISLRFGPHQRVAPRLVTGTVEKNNLL